MEYIDALNLRSEELNRMIAEKIEHFGEVGILNPHSMHNIGIGLSRPGKILVQGSTGFYTGGFLEGPTIIVEGNTGWYAGDNMMAGELIIAKNTGSNVGAYFNGGVMVIYGGTGSRVGYGMKGGTIIVCGSAGRTAGQMTMGGKLILLGKVGKQVGESMYKGVIYVQDHEVEEKLGSNVYLDGIQEAEAAELSALFTRYHIKADPLNFRAIRPAVSGRHKYWLFRPEIKRNIPTAEHNAEKRGEPLWI
jgi:Glutamate synthase domain 3